MINKSNRILKIAKELQKNIAIIMHQKIKDPRIKLITILDTILSNDLTYAKIFVTFMNIENQNNEKNIIQKNIKILNGGVTKYIRFLLKQKTYLRIIPQLTFLYDNSILNGLYISNIINNINNSKLDNFKQ